MSMFRPEISYIRTRFVETVNLIDRCSVQLTCFQENVAQEKESGVLSVVRVTW